MALIKETIIKYILIAVVVFIVIVQTAQAHDWDGDAWASQQLTLYEKVVQCADLQENNYPAFLKTCNMLEIVQNDVSSRETLILALDEHEDSFPLVLFIVQHFKGSVVGLRALRSIAVVSKGLNLIKTRTEIRAINVGPVIGA